MHLAFQYVHSEMSGSIKKGDSYAHDKLNSKCDPLQSENSLVIVDTTIVEKKHSINFKERNKIYITLAQH